MRTSGPYFQDKHVTAPGSLRLTQFDIAARDHMVVVEVDRALTLPRALSLLVIARVRCRLQEVSEVVGKKKPGYPQNNHQTPQRHK